MRSLLFSQCGNGASQCPPGNAADQWLAVTTAAVSWARANGAGQVTLVGASAVASWPCRSRPSSPHRRPPWANLSGERGWMGLDSAAAARRLGVPALFAVAPGDRFVSVATMRRLYQAAPVRAKRLVVLAEGAGHGWSCSAAPPVSAWRCCWR